MTGRNPHPDLDRRLKRTALACAGLVAGMVGLAYAAVPLYDLFCRMTGFDGTPIVRTATPAGPALDRTMAVRFDANVAPGLDWRFSAETPEVTVKVGETQTVLYRIRNDGAVATTGVAAYNVQPSLAGAYFVKIQCFCFTEQTLQPGQEVSMPVIFYVDPAILENPDTRNISEITLSYTFYPVDRAGSGS